jgi:hypothetical protein
MQGTCNSLNAIRCDVERRGSRDQLTYAFKRPEWERLGLFAGKPLTRGQVTWTVDHRAVVIVGIRGAEQFKETVA